MKKLLVNKKRVSDLGIPSGCGIGFEKQPYSLALIGLTQSLLGRWQTCRRSFLIALHRYTSIEKEYKTGFGTMMHDILDHIYTNYKLGYFRYKELNEVINIQLNNYVFEKSWTEQAIEMMKAKAQALLEEYIKVYKTDFTQMKFIDFEEIIQCQFNRVKLRGKRDGIIQDRNGGLWNLEHKNFGKIAEETLTAQLNFDLQNLFYMLIDEKTNDRLLNGTIYNVIRNPQTRKKISPNELYHDLKGKIQKDPDYYFYRYWIPYSRKQMKTFKKELEWKIEDLKFALSIPEKSINSYFYKNEKACTGVAYTCDYLEACSMDCLNGYIQTDKFFPEL